MKNKIQMIKYALQIPFKASKVAFQHIGSELNHIRNLSQSESQAMIIDSVTGKIVEEPLTNYPQSTQEEQVNPHKQRFEEIQRVRAKKSAYRRGIAFLQSQNLADDLAAEAWAELRDSYFNSDM
jgi:hypothetical protein